MNRSTVATSFRQAAYEQAKRTELSAGAPLTGFAELDRLIQGFLPGSMTVLGAETSVGKSTFAANVAANVAKKQGKNVLFFSLESGFSIAPIITNFLYPNELVTSKHTDIPTLNIVAPETQLSFSDIERISIEKSPDLIILDHIHYLVHSADNLAGSVSATVRSLQLLARRLNTHIIVISHLTKPSAGRENEIPTHYRLKDSSGLYQDPALVILLSRKRKSPEMLAPGEDIFESEGICVVSKNRDFGTTGIARFQFDKNKHTFIFPDSKFLAKNTPYLKQDSDKTLCNACGGIKYKTRFNTILCSVCHPPADEKEVLQWIT